MTMERKKKKVESDKELYNIRETKRGKGNRNQKTKRNYIKKNIYIYPVIACYC